MKKLIIFLSCSILGAFLLSIFIGIEAAETLLSTLYTVAGVVFSVGMSIAISPKTNEVTNVSVKLRIRESYKYARDSFIAYFAIDTLLFVLSELELCPRIHEIFSVSCAIFTLISVGYFVYNFIQLQKLGDEIEDRILKEKSINEQ